MKNLILFLVLCPFLIFGNDEKIPSKIKEVTVYLNGAGISRTAECNLPAGASEITLAGLSTKIDESSIQISGLQSVSILSMAYDINYLVKSESNPETLQWETEIKALERKISFLKNNILGLEEEQKVIATNRLISSETQDLDLDKLREISTYYRKRVTEIKNEIFGDNLEMNLINMDIARLEQQLAETNNAPEKRQGEIKIKFDAPVATSMDLLLSYTVSDAGWIPTYDLKSKLLNEPMQLVYKGNIYQKTGVDWNNVRVVLSTGNPNVNVGKPDLGAKYLDFVDGYQKRYNHTIQKRNYAYNPSIKRVVGTVTDGDGLPLPGCNVVIKGTSIGTTTDFDGNYSLDVQEGQELVFSYIGKKTKERSIYSSVMNVRLEEDAAMLEEVVVSAYSTNSNAGRTLQGKAAGIQIRGISGYGSSGRIKAPEPKLPLYVVDGVAMNDFVEGELDESEIQSIEVLKGENAIPLYGVRGNNGVVVITTKKSSVKDDVTTTKFIIKKPHSIASDGDLTAMAINTFDLNARYEYLAVPIVNENVFLTASFTDWERFNLLPGEANIYFAGSYAGKTTLDPYTTKKEMVVSLGIDPTITVTRKQNKNFKSKSFMGNSRVLDRTYDLEVKNNKNIAIDLKLMDRIPISQNKEIKLDDVETYDAEYDKKKGLLAWKMKLSAKETKNKTFSFQVKYPRYKSISL